MIHLHFTLFWYWYYFQLAMNAWDQVYFWSINCNESRFCVNCNISFYYQSQENVAHIFLCLRPLGAGDDVFVYDLSPSLSLLVGLIQTKLFRNVNAFSSYFSSHLSLSSAISSFSSLHLFSSHTQLQPATQVHLIKRD